MLAQTNYISCIFSWLFTVFFVNLQFEIGNVAYKLTIYNKI